MFFSGPQYVAAVIVGAEGVKRGITVAQLSSYDNPQVIGEQGFSKVARLCAFAGHSYARKCLSADCY
jgi:hypothetical protein